MTIKLAVSNAFGIKILAKSIYKIYDKISLCKILRKNPLFALFCTKIIFSQNLPNASVMQAQIKS